ncbi:hypothetical protein [Levilactobacillus huananensis]|uniref:hypothetical protein n=1 Tax=Levilactobacillus huananensis TaxID=2486019 RepID=UPI000F78F294|nr:hypothetical protein [Levilactobacillus huananensis]
MNDKVYFDIPGNEDLQKLIHNINESQKMALNRDDVLFIGLISGLQIVRQWLNKKNILNRNRLSDQDSADKIKHNKLMKNIEKSNGDRVEWILGPTSYDAIKRSSTYFKKVGIGGRNHRYTTLAHDPLIGLLVGPINLLSNTVTYNTKLVLGTSKALPYEPDNPGTSYYVSTPSSFPRAVVKAVRTVNEDKAALPDAIIKHLLHLASDIGTKQGLVIPGLSALPNLKKIKGAEINSWLLDNEFDFVWFADIFAQAGLSELINAIAGYMYRFLLYRDSNESEEFVIAKRQKVLAIANAMASSEDLAVSLSQITLGHPIEGLRELDWGGLLVTVKKIQESDEFKNELKGLTHIWDNLKFNVQNDAVSIENDFKINIENIDRKYRKIIQQMQNEYLEYSRLEKLAVDLDGSGKEMFTNSIQFAHLNNVNKTLQSKSAIDDFFNN